MWMKNPDPRIKPPLGSIIDWSHPLAEGLEVCLLFNEGTGKPYDLKRQSLCTGNISWSGASLDFDGTNNQVLLARGNDWPTKSISSGSIFAICYPEDITYVPICSVGEYDNNNTTWGLSIWIDSKLTFDVNGLNSYTNAQEFSVVVESKKASFGVSMWGASTRSYLYDGKIYGPESVVNIINYPVHAGNPYGIGVCYKAGKVNGRFRGSIELVYEWSSPIGEDALLLLSSEPYSFILWPSQTSIFDLAPGGSLIQRQAQAPLSWRRYFLKGAALNISSTVPAGREAQAPVSYNKELSRLFSIPAAMLLSVSKEGTALFEAIEGVSREALFPVDWFSTTLVVAGKEIPISAVRYVSKMADAPLEVLIDSGRTRELSYSWLLSISRDAVIPTEWQGALLITKEAVLPVDFTRLLYKGGSTSLDWTSPLESPKEAVVEFLKMVQGAGESLPLEVLSGLKKDITASLDWISSILSEKDLGPTWLVFRSVDEEVCLSWVVPVEDEKDLDISWLKGIAKSAGLPVEVAGKAVRVEMLRFRPRVPRMRAVFRLKDSQIKLN